jgi:hypothetical protein
VRIAYVAGFFKHVLPELQMRQTDHLESGAVVWIPPYGSTPEPNLVRFKGSFFDSIKRGATEILICLFVMRGNSHVLPILQAIVEEGKGRSPNLKVQIELFQDARNADGVNNRIDRFVPTVEDKLPTDLGALEKWVAEHHPGRIVLLPRALKGAKKSRFEDVRLIYAAINLLGNEYWTMRTSVIEQAAQHRCLCDLKMRELSLELAPAITEASAGREGDEYYVNYPQGSNEKRLLEYHLCKGNAREERFCLRIYFFWDEELRKVVIGWLPSHLDTRST